MASTSCVASCHAEGEFAIVLHTHMPYVEGFGTWPFGKEWLWEAAATSYMPLPRVLDGIGSDGSRANLTLSSRLGAEGYPSIETEGHVHAAATSWGAGGDLHTWSAPAVADLAWRAGSAEPHTFLHGGGTPSERARRDCWRCSRATGRSSRTGSGPATHQEWADDYPRQRASGQAAQLSRALKGETDTPYIRNLAPYLEQSYS